MKRVRSMRWPYLPKKTRLMPITTANMQGPARSPTVLDSPSADSAKADAHWAIDSSEAPEHTISTQASQKKGVANSLPMDMPLPSSTRCSMGQVAKL